MGVLDNLFASQGNAGQLSLLGGAQDLSKKEQLQFDYKYQSETSNQSTYSPQTSSWFNYAPTTTSVDSSTYAPYSVYSPVLTYYSPNTSVVDTKKATAGGSTNASATPTQTSYYTPTNAPSMSAAQAQTATSQPTQGMTQANPAGLLDGFTNALGGTSGLLLIGGAAVLAFALIGGRKK